MTESLLSRIMPSFQFMKHDKWSNTLFLHWKIPQNSEIESLLQSHVAPFTLDRTYDDDNDDDGSTWIGMVLLTEQNVGPSSSLSILRNPTLCTTHHGLNVRTYVRGRENKKTTCKKLDKRNNNNSTTGFIEKGIYFASLECDNRFTAWGANYFGMPYKVSDIERTYSLKRMTSPTGDMMDNELMKKWQNDFVSNSSARQVDDLLCGKWNLLGRSFSFHSVRSTRPSSLWNVIYSWLFSTEELHTTHLETVNVCPSSAAREKDTERKNQLFSVKCEWETSQDGKEVTKDNSRLAHFFLERYHVYTHKYGLDWRGRVHHEPWPVQRVSLVNFSMENIQDYEPIHLQPILRYMASKPPDSVLFSSGVGPIHFEMLQPV